MRCSLAGAVISLCGVSLAGAQSFDLVGIAPGGEFSIVSSLSTNGTAVGWSNRTANPAFATPFSWTRAGGRVDFGPETGMPLVASAWGVSGDGTTLVGSAYATPGQGRAYRFQGPGTFQDIGVFGFYDSSLATATSSDGSVVVGYGSRDGGVAAQAFRWTSSGGIQPLGFARPGHWYSEAVDISSDGSTIVGRSDNGSGAGDGFMWTASQGMQALTPLPGSQFGSNAIAVNADGRVIVGYSGELQSEVTRWMDGQPFALPSSPGTQFNPDDINDDGSVIVGSLNSGGTNPSAAIWTPDRGTESLASFLLHHGVSVPEGISLSYCHAVSGDGLTFGGRGRYANQGFGFVATIPSPSALAGLGIGYALLARRRRFE